jgi:hypothetical protein
MSNLTEMEQELLKLDKNDQDGGKATDWRLKNRRHKEGPDTKKRDLQEKLEKELLVYGMTIPILYDTIKGRTYQLPF